MSRSKYIYLVKTEDEKLLAAFTVKYESQHWAEKSKLGLDNLVRTRMLDGRESEQTLVPWEKP